MINKTQKNSDAAKNKPIKLADLITYHKGAVASKTILNKKTGTITVFAFDKGQGLSEHSAPYDAFIYVIDGVARIKISGKSNTVKSGELIVLPANKPHSVKAVKSFKMLLTMIRS